jgi:tetratricopeptide (TPR) repeat protein
MPHNKRNILGAILLSVLVAGCGPKKPVITQQQISDARNNGTLIQLYQKVQSDLAVASGSSKTSLQTLSNQIGRQLAADLQSDIYQTLEDNRLPSQVVSLSLIDSLKQKAEAMKKWDMARYNETRQKLTTESTMAQDALSKQLVAVSKLPVDDKVRRINAMSIAANIAGKESQHYQSYIAEKEQTIVNWMVEADAALSNRKYTHAASFLRKVLGLDPDNVEAMEKLAISEQEGFETSFRKALEDSKPELALSELRRIAKSPLFEQVKPSLASSIQLLNEFFINRALQNSSQGALKGAYKNFLKAREIRSIMGQPPQHQAEQDYLNKLLNFAAVKQSNKEYGEQIAYLEIINKFNPEFPKLQTTLQQARKNIVEYAATSMLVQDFSQTGTHHSAGKSVAKQVYSWVFDKMTGDVALVSAKQLSEADTSSPGRLLTLEGDILQAGVDSESSDSKKTMRVTTETIKKPNPAYAEWKDDNSKEPAPPEFLITEKKEDVTFSTTHVRKTGILSVNYRLIDQKSGQVLINESARSKQTFDGEGNEGVSIGEFKLEFKRPELPSDIEIMEKLSSAVATDIGNKLNELLQQPDKRYESLADKAIDNRNYDRATEYYGYATAIRGMKSEELTSLREKLINVVIAH